jgi:hypothetical protein
LIAHFHSFVFLFDFQSFRMISNQLLFLKCIIRHGLLGPWPNRGHTRAIHHHYGFLYFLCILSLLFVLLLDADKDFLSSSYFFMFGFFFFICEWMGHLST